MNKYEHLLNYKYVMKHERMSIKNRSSIFAPFSALSGYTDLIKEKEKERVYPRELSEEEKQDLDNKLKIIIKNLAKRPLIAMNYFVKEEQSDYGNYQKITEIIKSIDSYHHTIILENNLKIKIKDIIDIDSLDISFDN